MTDIIIFYANVVLLFWAYVMYTKFQFQDERGTSTKKGKWHPYGAMYRLLPFVFALIHVSWQHVLLGACIGALIFEGGVNLAALNKNFWFVGTTAEFDKKLGKAKWIAMIAAIIISIIILIIT